jgi:hypothetical protein
MNAPLEESSGNNSVTTFNQLPDKIQLMILKHLSLYDLYKTFSSINSRFNSLLDSVTPKMFNLRTLYDDVRTFERHSVWRFDRRIWWEESVYYLIPQMGWHTLRWKFISQRSVEQLEEISKNHHRIMPSISKYPLQLNTFFLVFNACTIKELYFAGGTFPQWMKENYSEQNKIIIDSDSRWYTKEVCNAFVEINKLERERQEKMIYEQAKMIWSELRESEEFLISDLPSFP